MKWMTGLPCRGALLMGLWMLSACAETALPKLGMVSHMDGTPSSHATDLREQRASAVAIAGLPAACLDIAQRLADAQRSVPTGIPVAALPPDMREQLRWRGRVLQACLIEAGHEPVDAGPEADPATVGIGR